MFRRFFDWLFGLDRPPDDPTLEVGHYFEDPKPDDPCADCGWFPCECFDDEDAQDYDPDHCEECGRPLPDECFRFICDDCSDAKEEGDNDA